MKRAEDLFKDIESKFADGETDFHADTSVYNALINCESYEFLTYCSLRLLAANRICA